MRQTVSSKRREGGAGFHFEPHPFHFARTRRRTAAGHKWEGAGGPRSGVLSTAGNVVFAADPSNNFVALNAATGQPLWRANLGSSMSNGPISYEMDGSQYVVAAAGDTLFGFVMNK